MSDVRAHIVFGMGFGDEGKGKMTDYLVRQNNAKYVIRFNGGSQAAHNVFTNDGHHHTFRQLGSGSFVPGVHTIIAKTMQFDPFVLGDEVRIFKSYDRNIVKRVLVHEDCVIITPYHQWANRIRELLRNPENRHGSCGSGHGECVSHMIKQPFEAIRFFELKYPDITRRKLTAQREYYQREFGCPNINYMEKIDDDTNIEKLTILYHRVSSNIRSINDLDFHTIVQNNNTVFEGAQGALLDEDYGFHPYTTWSHTYPTNALLLLHQMGFHKSIEITGVIRCYHTRHGNGPFPTFLDTKKWNRHEINGNNEWQNDFKYGMFDMVLYRYVLECCRLQGIHIDNIALTHSDVLDKIPVCESYRYDQDEYHITKIHPTGIYEQQEKLSLMLKKCKPYRTSDMDIHELSLNLEKYHIPIRFISNGPMQKNTILMY